MNRWQSLVKLAGAAWCPGGEEGGSMKGMCCSCMNYFDNYTRLNLYYSLISLRIHLICRLLACFVLAATCWCLLLSLRGGNGHNAVRSQETNQLTAHDSSDHHSFCGLVPYLADVPLHVLVVLSLKRPTTKIIIKTANVFHTCSAVISTVART